MSKYETAPYSVVHKEGSFEIRQYDAYITAAVDETSLRGTSGFGQIFDYISGKNSRQEKIAMTTPVFNALDEKTLSTEFVMPKSFTEETLPQPTNPRIRLKKVEPKLVASVTFSGTVNPDKIKAYEEKLLAWTKAQGKIPVGNFRLARYNPPFLPPMFRRNEVLLDLL